MTLTSTTLRFTVMTGAIASLLWCGLGQRAIATESATHQPTPHAAQPDAMPTEGLGLGQLPDEIAQLLYPPVSEERQGLMVVGQGIVYAPADVADIEVSVYGSDPYSYGYEWYEGEEPAPEPLPENSITTADAQALVNAIVAAGIPATAVSYEIVSPDAYSYSTDDYAVITVNLSDPTQDGVADVVDAVNATADASDYYVETTSVSYRVSDCRPLIQQAYTAAIADAAARAETMATALGVEIDSVPSVAESPFNLIYPPCDAEGNLDDSDFWGYNYWSGGFYDPDAPAEIRLQRDIFVTFPIRD
jgi:uncharacterized protein YggE